MLSPIIKKKIIARYKQEVKYPMQCEALASAMNAVCGNKISASTLKRLWGFSKASEGEPRIWTLDVIAEYVGYKSWEELQNDITGNKINKNKRIESVDCALLKPGKRFTVMFGRAAHQFGTPGTHASLDTKGVLSGVPRHVENLTRAAILLNEEGRTYKPQPKKHKPKK